MAKKQEKEIERWVTVNGARVPIFKDGSVGGPKALRDKVKAVVKEKSSDGKPLKDMSATDIGKEYLTATGERKKQLLKELHNRGYRRNKDGSWGKKEADKKSKEKSNADSYNAKVEEYKKTGKVEGYTVSKNEDGQLLFIPKSTTEKELQRAKEYKENLIKEHNNTKSRFKAKPSDIRKADEKIKELEATLKEGKDKFANESKTSKNETVEQAMDRLQKESRAKVDSMSAQQVMKYAKENGLRGLKTDTLAQRDDRVANHMYMQEMKKWREQKNVAENEALKEKQIKRNEAEKAERNTPKYDMNKLEEISERYNTSTPVSGNWDTEAIHMRDAIVKEMKVTPFQATQMMKNELGFSDEDFKIKGGKQKSLQEKGKDEFGNDIGTKINFGSDKNGENYKTGKIDRFEDNGKIAVVKGEDGKEYRIDSEGRILDKQYEWYQQAKAEGRIGKNEEFKAYMDYSPLDDKRVSAQIKRAEKMSAANEADAYDRAHKEGKYAETKTTQGSKLWKEFKQTDPKEAEWKINKAYDRRSLIDLAYEAGIPDSKARAMSTDELRAMLLSMFRK